MYGGSREGETASTLSAYIHLDAVDAVIELAQSFASL